MRPAAATAGSDRGRDATALLKLATFFSASFPIGAFSYSHGLEWLIAEGRLPDAASVRDWIGDLLRIGSGWNDAVLFAEAWRRTTAGDCPGLAAAAELAGALAGTRERHLETVAQGGAFAVAAEAGWPCEATAWLRDRETPYPIAAGAVAAGHAIPLELGLAAFLNAFAANLVSVAVRLVPLGQSAGLGAHAALHPLIRDVAARAAAASLDDLGAATIASDMASMRHETLYSRIFRT
ncbi:urease accessory UreF family protein [Propylenella binzhouense]|uniref:Urease accessory protein UreF n=1 Tax=Propylenella binzhouense TaxID=2555902 RepID=A0A964WV87_9HYPH|nr:urease accessory protein UreF [Propylenella binzhouense]